MSRKWDVRFSRQLLNLLIFYLLPFLTSVLLSKYIFVGGWYDYFWVPVIAFIISTSLSLLFTIAYWRFVGIYLLYYNIYNGLHILSVWLLFTYLLLWNWNPEVDIFEPRFSLFAVTSAALTLSREQLKVPPTYVFQDIGLMLVYLFTNYKNVLKNLRDKHPYEANINFTERWFKLRK